MPAYGFFDLQEIHQAPVGLKKGTMASCQSCGLYKGVKTPKMPPTGKFSRKILCVTDGPNEQDDAKGALWNGADGQRLRKELSRLGVDLLSDCFGIGAINCPTSDGKEMTDHERACCHVEVVGPLLEERRPHTILAFGNAALKSLIGSHVEARHSSLFVCQGWQIPDQKLNAWVCPTFSLSFINRELHRNEVGVIFQNDLKEAVGTIDKPLPDYLVYKDLIKVLPDDESAESVLRRILNFEEGKLLAFDYETTGIKPYAAGHKLVMASIATEHNSYAFMAPTSDRLLPLWTRFLRSPNLLKCAHNMKFEDTWSAEVFGVEVRGWHWDTMVASHVLSNRVGANDLKVQTYLNFGISAYDNEVSPYLKADDSKNSNAINNIEQGIRKLGKEVFLRYCAADSIFCRWLAIAQMKKLGLSTKG